MAKRRGRLINTPGPEWCPWVGQTNRLFFGRGQRPLIDARGVVDAVRVPGSFRKVFTEANPTREGRWLFFAMSRYTPVELYQDLYVAAWKDDGALGDPVPVDDWRP